MQRALNPFTFSAINSAARPAGRAHAALLIRRTALPPATNQHLSRAIDPTLPPPPPPL